MPTVPTITPQQLLHWQKEGVAFAFLDIREAHEVVVSRLTELNIPMAFCLARNAEIPRDLPVVIYCRTGGRSAATVSALMTKYRFENLYSLEGGIAGWFAHVNPEMEVG